MKYEFLFPQFLKGIDKNSGFACLKQFSTLLKKISDSILQKFVSPKVQKCTLFFLNYMPFIFGKLLVWTLEESLLKL